MSEFRLQKFSVQQSCSGMKVCADSLLFGALTPVTQKTHILDIGTGTGILSLMAAQLSASGSGKSASVTALEITPEAYAEAKHNFQSSPWSDSFSLICTDFREFAQLPESAEKFDLIISNPPFFQDQTVTSSDSLRRTARHTECLSYRELCEGAERVLSRDGLFRVLLPSDGYERFLKEASEYGLFPQQVVHLQDRKQKPAKVVMINLERSHCPTPEVTNLIRFAENGQHTREAREALFPFLLRYSVHTE